jgi:hypothetical protein
MHPRSPSPHTHHHHHHTHKPHARHLSPLHTPAPLQRHQPSPAAPSRSAGDPGGTAGAVPGRRPAQPGHCGHAGQPALLPLPRHLHHQSAPGGRWTSVAWWGGCRGWCMAALAAGRWCAWLRAGGRLALHRYRPALGKTSGRAGLLARARHAGAGG